MIPESVKTIIQGIFFSFALNAPMGATNIEIIRRGFREGWKASTVFAVGNMTIVLFYLILIMLGLSFLSTSKIFNIGLLFFGVVILLYLAYEAFNDFLKIKEINLTKTRTDKNNYISGALLSLGNPALILILMGLVGVDLSLNQISIRRGVLLSIGMLIGSIIFFFFFILLIQIGRKYISRKYLKYISLIAGLMLLYFAIKFGINLIYLIK